MMYLIVFTDIQGEQDFIATDLNLFSTEDAAVSNTHPPTHSYVQGVRTLLDNKISTSRLFNDLGILSAAIT